MVDVIFWKPHSDRQLVGTMPAVFPRANVTTLSPIKKATARRATGQLSPTKKRALADRKNLRKPKVFTWACAGGFATATLPKAFLPGKVLQGHALLKKLEISCACA